MKMNKILKIFLLTVFVLVVGLFAFSWRMGRQWGKDTDHLDVKQGEFKFSARRNEVGVWKIKADDDRSLWFALGYVETLDREFQMELMRTIATGHLAGWFGLKQLSRDRLMRYGARVARDEWDGLSADDPLRVASEAYVVGHNSFLRGPDAAHGPIEYRLFSLKREEIPAWEPWEVLAISKLHAWEFSYDLYEQIRSLQLKKNLGTSMTALMAPAEPKDSDEVLYKEALVKGIRPKLSSVSGAPMPPLFRPSSDRPTEQSEKGEKEAFYPIAPVMGAELGASNAWLIANPKTGLEPTLCNDTHLMFSWPGPLYPIEYSLRDIDAQGFALPGTPGIVIGRVDRPGKSFAWGVTIATYADTQDLISVSPETLTKSARYKESFKVRDPGTMAVTTRTFDETWTAYGPRVDETLDLVSVTANKVVALDWMGYRRTPSPMGFYVRRNLYGQDGLREDLAGGWTYPSVNFNWVERSQADGTRMGHVTTGIIYGRERRPEPRDLLSETEAAKRRFSKPGERPYVDYKYDGRELFFLATANQDVYPAPLGKTLGYEWLDRSRAQRLMTTVDAAVLKPEHEQTDFVSLNLLDFVRSARQRVSSNQLCSQNEQRSLQNCLDIIASLDRWDGLAAESSWETTLAALWYSKTKLGLWPKDKFKDAAAPDDLFVGWSKSNGGTRLLESLLHSDAARAGWEKFAPTAFDEVLLSAYRDSVETLTEGLGAQSSLWTWGNVHTIDWEHPVKFIPGLGAWLSKSLFGAPPGVPGALDSPGRFDFSWNPKAPLEFPSRHGAAVRMCVTVGPDGPGRMRWTAATGVSGNPLSKWAWPFAEPYYQGKLYPEGPSKKP